MKSRRDESSTHRPDPGKVQSSEPSLPGGEASVGVPLTRIVPRKLSQVPELVVVTQPRSLAAERFRKLRSALSNRDQGPAQVIVVTSAAPSEGKSLVAMNLALAVASGNPGEVPLLVDADLRRPTVEKWLTPQPTLGLSDLLRGQTTFEHTVVPLTDVPLNVLPAGRSPLDSTDMLSSSRLGQVISGLRKSFSTIILDTPPIVLFTDAAAVAKHSDGVILVVRAGITPVAAFRQATELAGSAAPIIGMVLNDLEVNLADRGRSQEAGYYDSYYAEGRKK